MQVVLQHQLQRLAIEQVGRVDDRMRIAMGRIAGRERPVDFASADRVAISISRRFAAPRALAYSQAHDDPHVCLVATRLARDPRPGGGRAHAARDEQEGKNEAQFPRGVHCGK